MGILDLGRPRNSVLASIHRAGSAVVLPVAGMTVGAREEYTYLHRSLDKYPHPEEMYAGRDLRLDDVWRMGPLGFAYGNDSDQELAVSASAYNPATGGIA